MHYSKLLKELVLCLKGLDVTRLAKTLDFTTRRTCDCAVPVQHLLWALVIGTAYAVVTS